MSDYIGQKFIQDGKAKPLSFWSDKIFNEPSVIYEVIRVEEGVPLFFDDYFERLNNSFRLINKSLIFSSNDLKSMINNLLIINECDTGPAKLLFWFRKSIHYMAYLMQAHLPAPESYQTGVHTILLHKERINPNAKVWNQQMRDATTLEFKKANAYEGILVDEYGYITEGSRSNIFFIKNGIVYTTADEFILPGITRKKVLQLCESNGIVVKMERIHSSEISTFDAAFITGTSRKVLPVKTIDSVKYLAEDETMQKISTAFENLVAAYVREIKMGSK